MTLLFSIVVALLMIVMERWAAGAARFGAGVTTILAFPIAKAAFFDANTLPLLPIVRGLFVYTFAVAVVVAVVEFMRRLAPSDHPALRAQPTTLYGGRPTMNWSDVRRDSVAGR